MSLIKKGDTVKVMSGKDRGKQAAVERVSRKDQTVLLPGINEYKKHVKPQQDRKGEIVTLSRPLPITNVAVVCPKCKQPTRVGYRMDGEKKVRFCRKCDQAL